MKKCSKCKKEKEYKEFSKSKHNIDGYKYMCKECMKKEYCENREKRIESTKKSYIKKRDYYLKAQRNRYVENKDKYKKYNKMYWENNKEKNKERFNNWRLNNKEYTNMKQRLYRKNKRKTDSGFRAKINLHSRMFTIIKNINSKYSSTTELIGCSKEKLKIHIENQFTDGMSWDNYGLYGWHIDHIKPCASFDLTDPVQQKKCFHYTNLQPLWAKDNREKSDKTDWIKNKC